MPLALLAENPKYIIATGHLLAEQALVAEALSYAGSWIKGAKNAFPNVAAGAQKIVDHITTSDLTYAGKSTALSGIVGDTTYTWRIKSGETRLLGDCSVKAQHRFAGIDDNGWYIKFNNGEAIVNGRPIIPGQKTHLSPGDQVLAPNFATDGTAARMQLVPDGLSTAPEVQARSFEAQMQTHTFSRMQRLKPPIADGFEFSQFSNVSTGFFQEIEGAGTIVVDRKNDPILKATIEKAKVELDKADLHDPVDVAKFLTQFTQKHLTPDQNFEAIKDWQQGFNCANNVARSRVLLGDYIASRNGLCAPKAALLKVLADETGLDCAMMFGGRLKEEFISSHAFNYFRFSQLKGPRLFDAELNVINKPITKSDIQSGEIVPASRATRALVWNKLSTRMHTYFATEPALRTKALPYYLVESGSQ